MRGAGSVSLKFKTRAKAEFSRARGDPKFTQGDCNADLAVLAQNSVSHKGPIGRSQRSSRINQALVKSYRSRFQEVLRRIQTSACIKAALFQEGHDRMYTIGERHVQIPNGLEEISKSGSVYNRRFLAAS